MFQIKKWKVGILLFGFLIVLINQPPFYTTIFHTSYAEKDLLMQHIPENLKNEVEVRFVGGKFYDFPSFSLVAESRNRKGQALFGIYYSLPNGKGIAIIDVNQSFEEVEFITLHEFGHHVWRKIDATERRSFCQNSRIEPKPDYDKGVWCEENFADYYARQQMVKQDA